MVEQRADGAAIRVLCFEDDEATGRLCQKALERQGLSVELTRDVPSGMARYAESPYDVVVVDYALPQVSGLEAIQKLRELPDPPPIVMVTGQGDEMVAVEAMKLGATDYLVKDVDNRYLALLPAVIESALAQHRVEMERREAVAALERSNEELRQALERQREHYRKLRLLNEMSDQLLACRSVEETYPVIARYGPRLFAGTSGAMGLIDRTGLLVEAVSHWGPALGEKSYAVEACWALRRERVEQGTSEGSRCAHFDTLAPACHLCVPMMGRGEVIGHLVLACAEPPAAIRGEPEHGDAQRRLAITVAGHVALNLLNLRMRESLRRQVIRDPLTDLYNRRFMEEALDREMRRARRQRGPLGVVILDIDHFKHLNDTEGHPAGDAVLRHLGKLLLRRVRGEDIVCRYGGEEFVLILPDTTLEGCYQLAEELRQAVESLRVSHFAVTASFGVAAFPDHGRTPQALVHAADEALYEAKAAGRNRVTVAASLARAV